MHAPSMAERDFEKVDAMSCAERARCEQDWNAGNGNTDLLHQDPEEDEQVRVMNEKDNRDRHRSLLSVNRMMLLCGWMRVYL